MLVHKLLLYFTVPANMARLWGIALVAPGEPFFLTCTFCSGACLSRKVQEQFVEVVCTVKHLHYRPGGLIYFLLDLAESNLLKDLCTTRFEDGLGSSKDRD